MSTYTEQKKRRIEAFISSYRDNSPCQAEIVQMMIGKDNMKKIPHPTEDNVSLFVAPCPREGYNCVIKWRAGCGSTNAYSKLRTCYGGRSKGDEAMLAAYWTLYDAKQRGKNVKDVTRLMEYAAGFIPEENAIYDWLEMITMENWIVTFVEKPRYRRIVKHDFKISYMRIAMVVFLLGEVFEEILTVMLVNRKAIGIHDGFTQDGIHFVCLYGAFIADEGKDDHHLVVALLCNFAYARADLSKLA